MTGLPLLPVVFKLPSTVISSISISRKVGCPVHLSGHLVGMESAKWNELSVIGEY